MFDFLRRMFGGEPGQRDEGATTAPLSDQQVQSNVHGRNRDAASRRSAVALSAQAPLRRRVAAEDGA